MHTTQGLLGDLLHALRHEKFECRKKLVSYGKSLTESLGSMNPTTYSTFIRICCTAAPCCSLATFDLYFVDLEAVTVYSIRYSATGLY